MTSSLSTLLPAPMRPAPFLLVTLALLTVSAPTSAVDVSYQIAAHASSECSAHADNFPYLQTAIDCPLHGLCFQRKRCCRRADVTGPSTCLDVTAFSCDTASACADTSSCHPETQDGGASLVCCQEAASTTEAPAVTPLDGAGLREPMHRTASLLVARCDAETSTACTVVTMFAPIIRAFCQNPILNWYTDAYLNENAPRMCCQYAAGPLDSTGAKLPNVGKVACGLDVLDLPRTGEYHCSLDVRAATNICCNGRIEDGPSSSHGNRSAAAPGEKRAFTYISSECLFHLESNGSISSSLAASVAQLLTVALLSLMAMYLCV
ncbi:hypothetical protein LSCM1_06893 [Leishmania martiniquensis]|uniref:GPI-anchored surface protein n=1 Tax=Leishmania martiniquensis TaxID=1580590 RepID=A0A836HRH0_9TRYP|nr:hypothetical protein LSCM1_06893 [Leishmania martiniquensis]